MDRFFRRAHGKARADQIPVTGGDDPPRIAIDSISLRILDSSTSFKTPKNAIVVVRFICKQSVIETEGLAFATSLVWKPTFNIQMADFTVELILKRSKRFRADDRDKLGSFLVHATQLISSEQNGICEKIYELPKSDKYPPFSLAISFSGLPISIAVPLDAGSVSIQQSSLETTTVPDVYNEPAVDSAENNTESTTAVEMTSAAVVTKTHFIFPVRSALDLSESLKDIPESLAEALGFAKGIADLSRTFADIHPISKVVVVALTSICVLVQQQRDRDVNIRALASSMRDMLASLSEIDNLEKIEILQSAIIDAMICIRECTGFIEAYVQYGFWGRFVRQSLSSNTADTVQRFQQVFGNLKEKFNNSVSIQTLKTVVEGHRTVRALKDDLRDIKATLVAQADNELLRQLPRSKAAAYDRGLQCLPGTRQDILNRIYDWIDSKEPGDNLFWLSGAAGSGKSTIASTVAAQLDSKDNRLQQLGLGSLGATFFCKRDDNRLNQPRLVFPTIAFRLASTFPRLKEGILSALRADPDIGESSITNQFRKLIVEPLSELPQDLILAPVVSIVDAVDECGNETTREQLLQCLDEIRRLPSWFKLLITSRREQDITACLASVPSGHEVATRSEQSKSDIRAYTQACLKDLRIKRDLGNDWPGESKVDLLCSLAEGLFMWTTLSFRFMRQEPSPTKAFELLLTSKGQSHMDTLYHTVLVQGRTSEERLALIRSILGFVVVAKRPVSLASICALLEIDHEEGKWAKNKLAPVLLIDSQSVIRVIHPSFLDFLTNVQRSNEFFIDVEKHNSSLARGILRVMNDQLRTNICRLDDKIIFNDEICDLASRLETYVPEELGYSCEFWTEHLEHVSKENPEVLTHLTKFCNKKILQWLEVMSWKGETRRAIMAVRKVQKWLQPGDPSMGIIQDLIQFCASFGYVIAQSAPSIYISSAIFIPRHSYIAALSSKEFLVPPTSKSVTDILWDPSLLTLNGHTDWVTSVAFSHDGKKIVSGSNDNTLRVWDAESGSTILGPLLGHTKLAKSVAFSHDGKKIVSGSDDNTLRVWEAESGSTILSPFLGHTDQVTSVAFSHDGKKIVSGSHDKTLRVWDAQSGSTILGSLLGHTDWVTSVAFSPDGKKIVSGSNDKTLRVWDTQSGSTILGPLLGHTDRVMLVTFSHDGKKIVSASYDRTLRVWDAQSGSTILGPLLGLTYSVRSVAFSHDGKKVVWGSDDNTLRVWDAQSGSTILGPLQGHTNRVTSVAFSHDRKKIVSGSDDRTLRVWDAESGPTVLGPLLGHTDWVRSVAFSHDGKKIVSGSDDNTLRVWDAESGSTILGPLVGHTYSVRSVAFSHDGKKIVSSSDDKTLRVWDAQSGSTILAPLPGHTSRVRSVAFSPDGKKIVSGSDDSTLRVWDAESGSTILSPFLGHTYSVRSIAFSHDGKKIVSGSDDNTLRVWDAQSGSTILGPLLGHTTSVTSVAFSHDGKKIVSGSNDKTLRVWDAESGSTILGPLLGHTNKVTSVVFSPDGKKIVSSSNDSTLRIWDAESGSTTSPLLGHTHWVRSVAFSHDGKKIVSGSNDKTLRVWDAESGSTILGPLLGHTYLVTSVAFSHDGKKVVSGSHDKTLRVWDAESGSTILGPLLGHTDKVTSVTFSPDGKKIVSGSHDKTLRVWDAESGSTILGPLLGHTTVVSSVAFSPCGKTIVSGSYDMTLRVWDAETGSTILGPMLGHIDYVTSVAFSSDGKKIASGSRDKTLHVWDAESGSTILGPLVGHTDYVTSVAFSPDGRKIMSNSFGKALRVWDAESGSTILSSLLGHDEMKILSRTHDHWQSAPLDAESSSLIPLSLSDSVSSWESVPPSVSLHATVSSDGWVIDSYNRRMLWIPAHLRGDHDASAVHGTSVVFFDSNRFPIIVNGLDLSWWTRAGSL